MDQDIKLPDCCCDCKAKEGCDRKRGTRVCFERLSDLEGKDGTKQ